MGSLTTTSLHYFIPYGVGAAARFADNNNYNYKDDEVKCIPNFIEKVNFLS